MAVVLTDAWDHLDSLTRGTLLGYVNEIRSWYGHARFGGTLRWVDREARPKGLVCLVCRVPLEADELACQDERTYIEHVHCFECMEADYLSVFSGEKRARTLDIFRFHSVEG